MTAEAQGHVELDGKVLVLRRIDVQYCLRVEADKREAAIRAHNVHAQSCPVARSIGGCIHISTSIRLLDV